MPNKVLVTGGAGFIGSTLCRRLVEAGDEVICLDNLFTGRRENVSELLGNDSFRLVEADVCDPYDFDVDLIFNLACPASPPHYQLDPVKTTKTSVLGAIHALDLATRTKARVLQASTSEVYGDPLEHPQTEDYRGNVSCTGPRACYDEGKRVAETLFLDYARTRSADVRIVRIFNTYGPGMRADDGRVVSNFICQALRGEDLSVYGDGTQTRSFCYVDDLVEGLVRMMACEGFQGPVNLGNPHEFTVLELAELVIKLTGSPSRIVFHDLPTDDPTKRRPNITLAQTKLGWEPHVELCEGLRKTISYFEEQLA